MSFHSVPSTPSASSETATFPVTASEFALLASFMAPLGIDERKGESVWVTGHSNGTRQWIAAGGSVTAVINESGIRDYRTINSLQAFEWAFPVPEHVLILLGKLFSSTDDIFLTVSDECVRVSTAQHDVTLTQVTRHRVAPLPTYCAATPGVTVSGADLWIMLMSATAWPGGGPTPDHEPIISCSYDSEHRQLVLSPRWSDIEIGSAQYRFSAVPTANASAFSSATFFPPFNLTAAPIVQTLRDLPNATRIGDVTIHPPALGNNYHLMSAENWLLNIPIVEAIQPWGHDLDDRLGCIPFEWRGAQWVVLTPAALCPGHIDLEAVAGKPAHHGNSYRLTYEILPTVVPTLALYDEINSFNCTAAQCSLLIEGSRLIARRCLSVAEYVDLEELIDSFVAEVAGLATLYSALAF